MKPFILLLATSLLLVPAQLPAAIPGAEALARLIASEFDTNSDEILDQGEWQNGIADSFGKLDADRDGSIKPDEIDVLQDDIADKAGGFGGTIVVALIKQVLMTLDSDGDKSVSRKEYDALADKIYAKLNSDSSAGLTLAELAELPVKLVVK